MECVSLTYKIGHITYLGGRYYVGNTLRIYQSGKSPAVSGRSKGRLLQRNLEVFQDGSQSDPEAVGKARGRRHTVQPQYGKDQSLRTESAISLLGPTARIARQGTAVLSARGKGETYNGEKKTKKKGQAFMKSIAGMSLGDQRVSLCCFLLLIV